MNEQQIEDRVKASVAEGVAWLEEKRPGWEWVIKLENFDVSHCTRCVLGQLFGDYFEAVNGSVLSPSEARRYGFMWPKVEDFQAEKEFERRLQKEWVKVIKERRRQSP